MKTRDATAADIDFLANAFLRAMRPYITAARGSWDQVKEDRQFREQLHLSSTRIILDEGNSVGFYMTHDEGHDLELHTLCIVPEYQTPRLGHGSRPANYRPSSEVKTRRCAFSSQGKSRCTFALSTARICRHQRDRSPLPDEARMKSPPVRPAAKDPDRMSIKVANRFHEANRRRWDAGSASWARRADTRGIWKRSHLDPSLALDSAELKWLNDVAGKSVAVLGSGDNQVVFALAGLGAKVTSIDISEHQIEVARSRAALLGLQVNFVRSDVIDLSSLADATFDVVYTGGYVAPWVSDLRRYYGEAGRILKPGGLLIVSEYHPFRRVWKRSPSSLELRSNYFDRGPYRFEAAPDVLYHAPGELEQFEFHWTVADYITATLASGCQLIHAEEFGDAVKDWEDAPMAGLPRSLLLVGRRDG